MDSCSVKVDEQLGCWQYKGRFYYENEYGDVCHYPDAATRALAIANESMIPTPGEVFVNPE
ncbi:hypothetical protein LCGC14_2027430 [marine sediment metagenome]|uniref:Uncharacterized protein n=1 Tax=marine sediment metagenome TaxID=412755 RepID=A0A0F9HSS2_9ZZZZ